MLVLLDNLDGYLNILRDRSNGFDSISIEFIFDLYKNCCQDYPFAIGLIFESDTNNHRNL